MKNILIGLLIGIPTLVSSQIYPNLVPNYSFEKVYPEYPNNPYGDYSADGWCDQPEVNAQDNINGYWDAIYNWRCPDRDGFYSYVGTINVLQNFPNDTRSGGKFLRGVANEYVTNQLNSLGLIQGKRYYIELFASSEAQQGQFYLSTNRLRQNGTNAAGGLALKVDNNAEPTQYMDQFTLTGPQDADPLDYDRARKYYTPGRDYPFIAFGNGGTWDDIRIYEVPANGCVEDWYFDNTEFNYPTEVFKAANNIYLGNGVDPENGSDINTAKHIAGNVVIRSNSNVILQAGNQIIITSGFSTEPGGSKVEIMNTPCTGNNSLCPNELTFNDKVSCNTIPIAIGDPNSSSWGTTVTWSPSTYLDNPNSPNPTFTPPNGIGAIVYTVTANYVCDSEVGPHTTISTITVNYNNIGASNTTLTATNIVQTDQKYSANFNVNNGVTKLTIQLPGYNKTFHQYADFTSTLNWSVPDSWPGSACINTPITITAYNECDGTNQVLNLLWEKSQYATIYWGTDTDSDPTAITPEGDGTNDSWVIHQTGADNYNVWIYSRWGTAFEALEHVQSGTISSNDVTLWTPPQNYYPAMSLYCIVHLTNQCGGSIFREQTLTIIPPPSGMILNPENQVTEYFNPNEISLSETNISASIIEVNENEANFTLAPNPADDIVNISGPIKNITKLEVLNALGEILIEKNIFFQQIEVDTLSKGFYSVKIFYGNNFEIIKFIKI